MKRDKRMERQSWMERALTICCGLFSWPITWLNRIRNGNTRSKALFDFLVLFIKICAAYLILTFIDAETYVFQCTTLADFIRPIHRTICPLIPHRMAFIADIIDIADENSRTFNPRLEKPHKKYITSNESLSTRFKSPLLIALVYLYDGSFSGENSKFRGNTENERLMQRVLRNREEYCRIHGYHMINANHFVDRSRPAAWSKLKAIDHYLHKKVYNEKEINSKREFSNSNDSSKNIGSGRYYDYLLYIDVDVVIMDLNRSLEEFIQGTANFIDPADPKRPQGSSEKIDFIMTEDWNGPNTGIWLVRNGNSDAFSSSSSSSLPLKEPPSSSSLSSSSPPSISSLPPSTPFLSYPFISFPTPDSSIPYASVSNNLGFSSWFLRTAWAQTQLIKKWSPDGKPYPFEYEQRAFHYLLDSPVWRKRGLQKYDGKESLGEIRKHFVFYPQCNFNSYSLHPFDFRGDRQTSQYTKGDFLIHFAGKKGKKKIHLLEHYLTISEAQYKH